MSFEINRSTIPDNTIQPARTAAAAAQTAAPAATQAAAPAAVDSVKLSNRVGDKNQVAFFAPTAPAKETASASAIIGAATEGLDIARKAAEQIAKDIVAALR